MNPCLRFAPMIGARPGELSEADAAAFSEHLAGCEACQARLADEAALSGLLSEALLAEAARRDFSTFADEVVARIPAYRPEQGVVARLRAWARRHRAAALAGTLVPTLAALALVVYVGRGPAPEQHAALEVDAPGEGATVLETDDGPVVLLGSAEGS